MGQGQSTDKESSHQATDSHGNPVNKQQHQTQEDVERMRIQRQEAIKRRLEEQKREQQAAAQEVIDFKNPLQQQNVQQKEQEKIQVQQQKEVINTNSKMVSSQIMQQKKDLVQEDKKPEISQPKIEEKRKEEVKVPQAEVKKVTPLSLEQKIHNFISDVFQITNDSADKKKTFLYEYCGSDKLFALGDIDDIIMSRLSKQKDENKFIYLFQCFKRFEAHVYVNQKVIQNADEVKESIVSYFNTCLQCPETFDLNNKEFQVLDNDTASSQQDMFMAMLQGAGGMGQAFGEKLCSNTMFNFTQMQNHIYEAFDREPIAVNMNFMNQLISIVKDDPDQYTLLFQTLFDKLHLNLNSIKIEKFRQAESQIELLKLLLEVKEAQEVFVKSPQFLRPGLNGKQIQQETYLGRYLSFSCLSHETRGWKDQHFKGFKSQSGIQRQVDNVADQLFNFHKNIQDVISKLLKNKDCKDHMLNWLRTATGLNQAKEKMFTNVPVASDGFILNLIDVMLMFCKPFTSKFSEYATQFPKINAYYLINNKYVIDANKIEKIDSETVQLFLSNQLPSPVQTQVTQEIHASSSFDEQEQAFIIPDANFVTECFFLTHLLTHQMQQKVEKLYEQIGREINKAAGTKDMQMYEEYLGMKLCLDVHLVSKNILAGFRSLFTFTGALFIAMNNYEYYVAHPEIFATVDTFQERVINLPIEPIQNMPLDIAALPQCLISNIANYPKLFRIYQAEAYLGKEIDLHTQLATNVSIILNKRVKNPHIRAEMLQFAAILVPQSVMNEGKQHKNQRNEREDNMYKDVFFQNITMRKYLMNAIVVVYIDCERTGYYEKNNFRFYASLLMEYLWSDQEYRERFTLLAKERPGLFIEFCNFIINDLNNLLFEGLLELEEIKDYEELSSSPDWNQLDNEQREQMKAKFDENKRKASAHLQLSNMVVKLLSKVTATLQSPFISEELSERFANALNYCLDALVGQKGLKLKVNNPEQYNFDPRGLLINILNVYANMSSEDKFLQSVVNDSRSFKSETFDKAVRIINSPKKGIQLDQVRQTKFEDMVNSLKAMKNDIDQEEGLYDDAPEEFLDPLMSTLMKEPVELPSSHTIIDYLTIKKHLMNEPNDPFNRSPLTLEQLIPRPDIKERIEEYKEKKRTSQIKT